MQIRVRASLRFPLEGSEWARKLLLGGATGLLLELVFVGLAYLLTEEVAFGVAPLVVLLNFPAIGYVLTVYQGTLRWDDAILPEWEDWTALFRRGLGAMAVVAAYGLVPLLILLLGLNLLIRGGILLFLGMVLMVLGVLASIFVGFFLPVAVAQLLVSRRLEAAFHPGTLWGSISTILGEYVATYVLGLGAFILAALVAAVPYLGPILWPFACFYIWLVLARLYGEICARTL